MKKVTEEPKPKHLHGTPIVPPIIFVLVLVSIVLIPFLLAQLSAPDDGYPEGSYVIPSMETPVFDGVIGSDWNGALRLDITFTIPQGPPDTYKNIETTIWLGHDREYLFVGHVLRSIGPNPYSGFDAEGYVTYPDYLHLFFDFPRDYVLTFPEDAKSSFLFLSNKTGEYQMIDSVAKLVVPEETASSQYEQIEHRDLRLNLVFPTDL